jgi:hypothetical protein
MSDYDCRYDSTLMAREEQVCSLSGEKHPPAEGWRLHSTLSGATVWEPPGNWGMDYMTLEEAMNYGCIPGRSS